MLNEIESARLHELILDGTFDLYRKYCLALYFRDLYYKGCPSDNVIKSYEELSQYIGLDLGVSPKDYDLLQRYYNSRNMKIFRLKKRIDSMLKKGDCLFLTLTFRDDVLDSTSSSTRRVYVRRFLKSFKTDFVANIDFGVDDNYSHREHYHAVILYDYIPYDIWEYGWFSVERIRTDGKSSSCIAKYINKLSNHAYKDSTRSLNNLIYSR